jgi:hypothetical protein
MLVYGNKCSKEDLNYLDRRNVKLSGAIVICREGNGNAPCMYTVDKMMLKRDVGAVMCFKDPRLAAPKGMSADKVYPNDIYMPGDAAMRLPYIRVLGDQLTPKYPSVAYVPPEQTEESLETERQAGPLRQQVGYEIALRLIRYVRVCI